MVYKKFKKLMILGAKFKLFGRATLPIPSAK